MRRNLVIVAVVVVLVALGAFWKLRRGGDPTPTAAHRGAGGSSTAATGHGAAAVPSVPASIAGRVTRRTDGAGIPGAVVSLARAELGAMFDESAAPTIVVTADAQGAWTAPQVPPGTYLVSATAIGFLPNSRDKLVVGSGDRKTGIDFVLDAGGTLVTGTISDVGGGPIAGARITVKKESMRMGGDPELVALAGPDGGYQIALPDGSYEAEASHDDYTRGRHHLELAGKPLTVDFVLTPGGVIRGQVITRDGGKPLPGAMVEAEGGRGRRGNSGAATADAKGEFTLRKLGSGAVSITASGRGYATSAPVVVELGIGEQIDDVRVIVDRAFSISGVVVRKGKPGEPIAGVRLGAFSIAQAEKALAPEPSAADGTFEIIGVRPASYMLFAVGEGIMPEIGKQVEVVDKDVTGITLEMATGATLSGRVDPPAVATLTIEPLSIGIGNIFEMIKTAFVRGESDATGAFVLHNVPAGAFSLIARTRAGKAGKITITVTDADQANLLVPLEQRSSFAGRVVDPSGAPVVGVNVEIAPVADQDPMKQGISFAMDRDRSVTGADGTFREVGLDAGPIGVTVHDDQGLLAWADGAHKAKPKEPIRFELPKGAELGNVTLTVEPRDGVIRGVVLGADRKPAADAWVTATPVKDATPSGIPAEMMAEMRGMSAHAPVLTGADGKFTIDRLRRGAYALAAETAKGSARGTKDNVKTGDSVTLELAPLGTLTGNVTAGATPVATYDLDCRGDLGMMSRRISDAGGAYSLERLAPGSFTCTAIADQGTGTGKVEVPAGPAQLDLALQPWASVTGVVVSVLDGRPVAGLHVLAGEAFEQHQMVDTLLGKGPTTDAAGRFLVPRLGAGDQSISLLPPDGGMQPLDKRTFKARPGERVDLGTIKIVPPRSGDAGTFGLVTEITGDVLAVTTVKPGGPAELAGVLVGDHVVSIEGQPVDKLTPKVAQLVLASGSATIGQALHLELDRSGTKVAATVTSIKW